MRLIITGCDSETCAVKRFMRTSLCYFPHFCYQNTHTFTLLASLSLLSHFFDIRHLNGKGSFCGFGSADRSIKELAVQKPWGLKRKKKHTSEN